MPREEGGEGSENGSQQISTTISVVMKVWIRSNASLEMLFHVLDLLADFLQLSFSGYHVLGDPGIVGF